MIPQYCFCLPSGAKNHCKSEEHLGCCYNLSRGGLVAHNEAALSLFPEE